MRKVRDDTPSKDRLALELPVKDVADARASAPVERNEDFPEALVTVTPEARPMCLQWTVWPPAWVT
ncbi:hypothetical protein GCM10011415_35540 [Salipiger pallidus]|uniref:Uncharacterized protein n=1 Tax=Salipiger pallidus TaxID=1775170 RepID=A0A8J2ZN31_9RHOB|nr:hypothetical protein GCM10011415_35540 [Salipiger pallidus]